MDVLLFSTLFLVFAVIYYFVGVYAAQEVHTQQDYFLAGRNLGFWSLTGTLLATQLGGGMILGTAADSYALGMPGIFYSVGMAAGFLVLGLGFAGVLRSFNIATTAELFEKQFGSKRLKKLASLLSILSLAGIFLAQVIASKELMVGLGVHNDVVFIAFWALLIGYTMYGGLPAVVATDLLQVAIIVGVFGGLFARLWWQGDMGLCLLSNVFVPAEQTSAFIKEYWFSYIGMPLLFSLVEQDLAQRFFSARSRTVALLSSLMASGAVLCFAAIPVCFGIYARVSQLPVAPGMNPLIAFMQAHTSPFMYALVMCALIAAIASTADSLLCAISSNVVQDFLPQAAERTALWAARVATVLTGVSGVVGAYWLSDILQVLTQSYQLLVSSIFVSVLVCVLGLPRNTRAAAYSVGGGFLTYSALSLVPHVCIYGVPRALVALLVSMMGYLIGIIFDSSRVRSV